MRVGVETEAGTSARARPERFPGLDGLRALAVAAVVLFHLGRLPGGNLGVDAFFVLSGWLITTRLLAAADGAEGAVDLRGFWAARVRRLAPASLAVVCTVSVVWSWADIAVPSLHRDVFWALASASNWGTITAGGDYWARFGEPSPLAHYWSLAVEEQFYLVWPLLLVAVTRRRTADRDAWIGGVSLGLAAASIAFMVATFDAAHPTATYMNSLARAHSLLIGVAAAALTARPSRRAAAGRRARQLVPVAMAAALAIVLASSERSTWLFAWGFPAFAIAMAVIVVAVATGRPTGLDARPLRWIGDRSYGIYLWHWPAILLLRGDRAPIHGAPLDGLRVGVAVVLAAASHRWLETPIRQRRVVVRWQPAVLAVGAAAVVAVAVAPVRPPVPSVAISTVALPAAATHAAADTSNGAEPAAAASSGERSVRAASSTGQLASLSLLPTEPPAAPAPPPTAPAVPLPVRTLVVGDSTAVRLSEALLPYAAAHPDQVVAGTAAFGGCGLSAADDGRRHTFTNASGQTEDMDLRGCVGQWRSVVPRIATEQIDVVLVVIGPWDGVDIHLPTGVTVSVLDPVGQRLVASAYRRFVADVQAAGARVVWVTPADVHLAWAGVTSPLDDGLRWRALRAIVGGLGVDQVDLPRWLRANGWDGPAGRPDGVHLAPEANERFVREAVVPALVASGSAPVADR
jgi:peptidoglycan/LPS O-acetylase OafA/YrhL